MISWHSDVVRQRFLLQPYRPFLQDIVSRADCVIVSSLAFRENSGWLCHLGECCVPIPYGVDLRQFDLTKGVKSRIQELQQLHGIRTILFVGRLVYYKGLGFLLEAIRELEAKLLIVGRGPLEKHHRRHATKLGLEEKVEFLGELSKRDLVAHLHAYTLLVLRSASMPIGAKWRNTLGSMVTASGRSTGCTIWTCWWSG